MIMDHDLDEMLLANGVSSSTNRTMTATTLNGTVSASDNATTTILNLFRYSAPPQTVSTFRPPQQQQMNKNHFIPDMILSALSSPTLSIAAPERALPTSNLTNSTVGGAPSSIPSSCSLIFDTAASFNINQQDTVVYARESIRLLAKSLAMYSDHYQIIQRLYAYAPDNLAWLWAFFDWESPIDLSHVACQDSYEPFGWCDEEMISAGLTDEQMTQISRIYADAPLIQYKYRQELMIGDLHNFLQHINEKVPFRPVAISLLVLYFPRFAPFINNPWKNILNPKILSSNVSLIRELDTMLVKLIGTRYNNIREYKKRIYDGPHGLPTYVSEALKEINFWSSSSAANQLLVKNLTSGMTTSMSNQSASFDRMLNNLELIRSNVMDGDVAAAAVNNGAATTMMASSMVVGGSRALPPPPLSLATTTSSASSATLTNEVVAAANFSQSIEDFLKTYNYLRLLQKNKVNSHLDYADDMEEKTSRLSNETSNDDDQSQQQASNSSSTGSTEEDQQQQTRSTTNLYTQFGELKLDEMPSSTTTTMDDQQQHMRILSSPILCSPPPQPLNESLNTSATMMMEMMMSSYRQHQQQQQQHQQQNTESYRRMNCMSPPPPPPQHQQYPTYHQPSNGRNILNTPQTPSNCFDTTWSKSQHQRSINLQTPPPSACKTTDAPISSFYTDTTHYETAKNATTTANGTVFVSSPIPVNRDANSQMFFGRRKGAAAANTPQPLLSLNMNKSTPYHNNMSMLNETDYSSAALATPAAATPNEFVMPPSYVNTLGALNVNTNLSPTSNGSLFSPAMIASPIELSSNAHHTNSSYHYRQQQNTPTKRHNNSNNHNNSHLTMASPSGHHYSPHMRAWKGQLPPKIYPSGAVYSRKVFLGGLPWDLNQNTLMASLFKYGTVRIEVPGKDSKHPRVAAHAATPNGARSPYPERNTPGYVYMIFDHEASVARLLADCHKQIRNGGEHYFYSIFIPPSPHHYDSHRGYSPAGRRQGKVKEVEVIPWNQEDTSYVPQFGLENAPPAKIETSLTVFVGGLHGMCNAQGLCTVMSEVFGEVIHASLDVDKHKYPIGSGRVTFRHRQSYVKAIKAQYVHIKANQEPEDPSPKFEKTIQIDPYLDDCKCSKCEVKASLFCRNECCLENFCMNCWSYRHDQSVNGEHIALSRQTKPNHHT